jgi:hypothetical protein
MHEQSFSASFLLHRPSGKKSKEKVIHIRPLIKCVAFILHSHYNSTPSSPIISLRVGGIGKGTLAGKSTHICFRLVLTPTNGPPPVLELDLLLSIHGLGPLIVPYGIVALPSGELPRQVVVETAVSVVPC